MAAFGKRKRQLAALARLEKDLAWYEARPKIQNARRWRIEMEVTRLRIKFNPQMSEKKAKDLKPIVVPKLQGLRADFVIFDEWTEKRGEHYVRSN